MAQVQVAERYWNSAEHQKYMSNINVDRLFRWLNEYESLGDSFDSRNACAFRFANLGIETSWQRMALVAAEPDLLDRHRVALAHLASASYTRLDSGPYALANCLADPEPRVSQGALILLPLLRSLRADGTDDLWPSGQLADPLVLPRRASRVLAKHPELGMWVARALESYGQIAVAETRHLVPLLLSDNKETATAARSAVCKMDPKGIARTLNLQEEANLTPVQLQQVREFLSTTPGAQNLDDRVYSCPQFKKHYDILWRLINERPDPTDAFEVETEADMQLAVRFAKDAAPEEWWPVLSAAELEWEFRDISFGFFLKRVASVLYQKAGSRDVVLRILNGKDPAAVARMVLLIPQVRQCRKNVEYLDGDSVDAAFMADKFVGVVKDHPFLCIYVMRGFAAFGSQAQKQVTTIVRYLMSDDPMIVWTARRTLTQVDPNLATALKCSLDADEYGGFMLEFVEASILNETQRRLVQKYLDSQE